MLTVAFFGFFQLIGYLNKKSSDILVTNLISVPAILATRLVKPRPKVIASIQGFPKFLGMAGNPDYPLWMKLEDSLRRHLWNLVYVHADLIVCMTEVTRDKLVQGTRLPGNLFRVINNPVIEDEINALVGDRPNDHWFFEAGYKRIIAIGRLTRQKDFFTLVKALEIVSKKLNFRAAILGEGEDRAKLEDEISERGLTGKVRLYGFVDNPYAYLGHADLFVLTSIWEDPGHAIIEAAALGIPVVSTDCPSGPGVLLADGREGGLCPVGDFECLAREIEMSLTGNNQEARIEIARANAQRFSLLAHYEAYKEVLELWQGEPSA
jgi:glycosyltransferase involved in cell wall biosynthesis